MIYRQRYSTIELVPLGAASQLYQSYPYTKENPFYRTFYIGGERKI